MKIAVGIMSGTSLDGIDVAVARISGSGFQTKIEMIAGKTVPFDEKIKEKIHQVMTIETSNVQNITSLHYELADVFADAVLKTLQEHSIKLEEIAFVASHGQTIWHEPYPTKQMVKSTLQIGEGAVLAERLRTTVVSNFRAADIAAGGHGPR